MSKKVPVAVMMAAVIMVAACAVSFAAPKAAAGMSAAQREALTTQALGYLKSQEWAVYLTAEDGTDAAESDVLTFTGEGRMNSKNLSAKGFGESNFRLTIQPNGTPVWETMKVDKDKNLAFYRGELSAGAMKGSVFMKNPRGNNYLYNFSTVRPGAVVIGMTAPAVVEEEAPKAAVKKETSKKKGAW